MESCYREMPEHETEARPIARQDGGHGRLGRGAMRALIIAIFDEDDRATGVAEDMLPGRTSQHRRRQGLSPAQGRIVGGWAGVPARALTVVSTRERSRDAGGRCKMTRVKARRHPSGQSCRDWLNSDSRETDVEKIAILEVDVKVAAEGERATAFIGTNVYNSADENIGYVDDLMIDDDESRVRYAILSVGGFLGLGSHLVAVPFDRIEMGEDRLYLPDATREELERLPQFHYR
jgi:sporulation protein YlmC with PRC-barrel domain